MFARFVVRHPTYSRPTPTPTTTKKRPGRCGKQPPARHRRPTSHAQQAYFLQLGDLARACRLGRAVRELRARRDLSQEQLGFHSGLHRNYVGAIERGEINPTFKTLLTVAAGLSLPLSEVVALYERRRVDHLPAEQL